MKKIILLCLAIFSKSFLFANTIAWNAVPDMLSVSALDNSSSPAVGIDRIGNIIAIWIENDQVHAKTKTWNGSWSSDVVISSNGATNVSNAILVVDTLGNGTAMWLENGVVTTTDYSGSWTLPPSTPFSTSGTGASSPALAIDGNGNVAATWALSSGIIVVSKSAGSWGAVAALGNAGADLPQVGLGNSLVVPVWHEVDSGVDVVYSSNGNMTGTFASGNIISNPSNNSSYPQVVVDSSGNALACWYQYDLSGSVYSNVYLEVAEQLFNENWSSPVSYDTASIVDPANLMSRLYTDSNGNKLIGWMRSPFGNANQGFTMVHKANGQNSTLSQLSAATLYLLSFGGAVSPTGYVVAAGMYNRSTAPYLIVPIIETNLLNRVSNYWTAAYPAAATNYNGFPQVAICDNGTNVYSVVLWLADTGSNQVVEAIYGSKQVVQPPTALNVSQTANASTTLFTEYVNTLTWAGSSTAGIVNYDVYRNGFYIATVPANTLSYVDHNQEQTNPLEPVTYGVAAVMSDRTQSIIQTIQYP